MNSKGHVVVVGTGLAGLCAAMAAAERGSEVTVMTKSPPGLGNCTTVAGGGFTLAVGGWTAQEHEELTFKTGYCLNQPDLVETLSQQAPAMARRLQAWGVPFSQSRGSIGTARYAPHALRRGEVITGPLVAYLKNLGVKFLSRTLVTEIFCDDKGVCGLQWLDKKDGQYYRMAAAAVVLATGGAGRVWGRTDNPPGSTGDGFRLAFSLGLPFRDMEFVQFYPLGVYEPGFTTWMVGLHMADRVPLTDEQGHDILSPWLEEWGLRDAAHANLVARDRVSVRLGQLYSQGKSAYLHVDQLPQEEWKDPDLQLLAHMYPRHRSRGDAPVRVAPLQHYMCGGVVITSQAATELPGLWVCGELAGGVDGANRVGGNALSHCMVFGYRAGQQAAQRQERSLPRPARGSILHHQEDGMPPDEIVSSLQSISERYLGPVRSEVGLARAQEQLCQLRERLGSWQLRKPSDRVKAYQAHSAWVVARLVGHAARMRTESRGTHYRSDYPHRKECWNKPVVLRGDQTGDQIIAE